MRRAISHRVREGHTWKAAAEAEGLSQSGINKARKAEHVKAYIKQVEIDFIHEVETLKAPFKAQAFIVGNELMRNAKSESVRARMVEFFAGESKGGGVNVAVQVNSQPAQGYAYVRPGQSVVKIVSPPDTPSSALVDITPTE